MKREFSDENFEDFLKRSADNLRMKAPDRVWEKLSGELSKRKRRFGFGLSAFFLVTAVLSYLTISNINYPYRRSNVLPPASAEKVMATIPQNTVSKPAPIPSAPATRGVAAIPANSSIISISPLAATTATAEPSGSTETNAFEPIRVDDFPETAETNAFAGKPKISREVTTPAAATTLPWTIESVSNIYLRKRQVKQKRFQTQFYFSPTISYRKLSENKSYLRNTQPSFTPSNYNVLYTSVNNMVTHKPDIGFELGVTEKYSLSKNARIRAGLQFNVNRYDIKAFQAPYALATIALNNRRTATVDSVWTIANYSNVDVNSSNRGSWLQNYSAQVSAPVGAELDLKGNEKTQFGIAATVQPTYVLGDRAYLITSDYKSYTQVPWLLRRWNVNTAFEMFVSYQSGRTRWQVGPQVRYQLLSSFVTNYPVKENLFDFGLKIGVSVVK